MMAKYSGNFFWKVEKRGREGIGVSQKDASRNRNKKSRVNDRYLLLTWNTFFFFFKSVFLCNGFQNACNRYVFKC